MKYSKLILLVLAVCILFAAVRAHEMYSDKYDNIDVDETLANPELRLKYYNCFMDRGDCTEEQAYFKGNMPEAVVTNCAKCTEWQMNAFDKIATWYSANDKAAWDAMIEKFIEEAKKLNIKSAAAAK